MQPGDTLLCYRLCGMASLCCKGCAVLHMDQPEAQLCFSPYVLQFLGSEVMSSSEARQQRINEVVSTYQRYPGDTGSTEVQGML